MSLAKKKTYIPASLIGTPTDPLRSELGAHWIRYKKSEKFSKHEQLLYLADNTNNADLTIPTNIKDFTFSEETDVDSARWTQKKVTMRIYGDPNTFESQKHWRAFVLGTVYNEEAYAPIINTGTKYTDHVFTCEAPFTEKEASLLGGSSLVKTYDVDLEYNFYQREYERLSIRKVPERLLPNLYVLYSFKEEEENDAVVTNKMFRKHVSLGGALNDNTVNQFTDIGSENPDVSNSDEYLKSFSYAILDRTVSKEGLSSVIEAYQNVMLPASNLSILGYNVKREMFPMYSDITFATDKTTQFTQILLDCNASCTFMKDIYDSTKGSDLTFVDQNFTTHVEVPVQKENELGTTTYDSVSMLGTSAARIWNMNDWYEHFQTIEPTPMVNGIYLGHQNRETQLVTEANYGFYKKLMETIFSGKLRTLIKSQQRRFADVIDGDSSYSEEVFYKIEKYAGNATGTPMQTFWIPNTNEVDIVNFIDTQVKYNKKYTYVATVHKLVIGASYRYSNVAVTKRVTEDCVEFIDATTGDTVSPRVEGDVTVNNITGTRTAIAINKDDRFMAEVDVTMTPEIFLVEVPFFTYSARLIDDPPMPPEIDILPYRTDSRFLKFFMQGSTGELEVMPIILTDKDRVMVQKIRSAKNLSKTEPIVYKADDYPSYFEIYRLDEPPRSYKSFRNNRRAVVKTDISDQTAQKASSAAYVEQILPNIKYYYMFRSIDLHGKTGYPSPVYEIEMVEDKGAFYPIVKVHTINPRLDLTTIKSGRRFVQIIPNIGHTLINEVDSAFEDYSSAKDIPGDVAYGFKEDPIWGKKFKVRITSKKTGRKMDFNLQFKTKRVKTDFEAS